MEIAFDFEGTGLVVGKTTAPVLVTTGDVIGNVILNGIEPNQLGDDARLEIVLKGVLAIKAKTCSENPFAVERTFLSMTQTVSLGNGSIGPECGSQRSRFCFSVGSALFKRTKNGLPLKQIRLPEDNLAWAPSMSHVVHNPFEPGLSPTVISNDYSFTTSVITQGEVVKRHEQPVVLLFATKLPPPIFVQHFPDEYCTHQDTRLKSALFREICSIRVDAQEPHPAMITENPTPAVVDIGMRIRIQDFRKRGTPVCPKAVNAVVEWRIRTSTFFSPDRSKQPRASRSIAECPFKDLVESLSSVEQLTVKWTDLVPAYENENALESIKQLRLKVPKHVLDTPTFQTADLMRRYSIVLNVKITSPGSGEMKLEIPLQVGLKQHLVQVEDMEFGTKTSLRLRDELLPHYPID